MEENGGKLASVLIKETAARNSLSAIGTLDLPFHLQQMSVTLYQLLYGMKSAIIMKLSKCVLLCSPYYYYIGFFQTSWRSSITLVHLKVPFGEGF